MLWTEELFGVKKPIIAMCHLRALPGDPYFDKVGGMKQVVELARRDLLALQNGGVDAVMFSNEFSRPYLTDVHVETVASMARIIGELMPDIRIPYGVNVLWDPKKSLDLAVAVEACFVREIFTGLYASGGDSLGVLMSDERNYLGFGGVANGWAYFSGYITGESVGNFIADSLGL